LACAKEEARDEVQSMGEYSDAGAKPPINEDKRANTWLAALMAAASGPR
jgi:hypothetical protein